MKDTTRRIFEKENQAEVSNNIEKRNCQKSLTQLVSLSLLNRQPKIEFKSIDLNKNYTSMTQRNQNGSSLHYRPEAKQKTTVSTTEQMYSPIKIRQTTSISVCQENLPKNPVNKLLYTYGDCILSHYQSLDQIQQNDFLKNHTISKNLRAKMVDWMVEVLTSYKCRDQTFFMAVRVMDNFLQLSPKSHQPQDLHLIGVTCMFIASKFEEIYPVKLQIVHEKIAHKKLSKEEIREKESQIAHALDFKFVGVTLHEIICMALSLINQHQNLFQITIYLAKMALYDYEIISQYTYSMIAGACIIIGSNLINQDEDIIPMILQTLSVDKDETIILSEKILNLAQNFDKQFPSLENLKKFNKHQILDILKLQQ